MIRALAVLLLSPLSAAAQHAGHGSAAAPYAGLDTREVARFSPEDVQDLLAGRGMGYALSAELNGHPGPAHLLELGEPLGLDEGQVASISAVRDRMTAQARRLGADLLAAEQAIDAGFVGGDLDAAGLAPLVAKAARIEGELRAIHLAAHLEILPLLTQAQVVGYARLRGYGAATHEHEARP